MLAKLRDRRLLWPTAMTIAGLILLLGLGKWQLDRKAWKEGLIAAISARVDAPAISIEDAFKRVQQSEGQRWDGDALEYVHVRAAGTFDHTQERHVYEPTADGPGWLVFTPLYLKSEAGQSARADEPCADRIIVNRGWVPDALKDPVKRAGGQVTNPVEINGLLRKSMPAGFFTPAPDPARNMYYSRDVAAMFGACGAVKDRAFILDEAAETSVAGDWPRGGTTRLEIPNRHLEYAITWFGLAAALLAVFLAYAVPKLRSLAD